MRVWLSVHGVNVKLDRLQYVSPIPYGTQQSHRSTHLDIRKQAIFPQCTKTYVVRIDEVIPVVCRNRTVTDTRVHSLHIQRAIHSGEYNSEHESPSNFNTIQTNKFGSVLLRRQPQLDNCQGNSRALTINALKKSSDGMTTNFRDALSQDISDHRSML